MNADEQMTPAAAGWDPGQVELTVQMDLGSAPLTLSALQSLQAGYVFELSTSVSAPVTARVNGVSIGAGELVRIGDRLGVRLLEVHHHAE